MPHSGQIQTNIKRKGFEHMTTIKAAFGGGIELVNCDEGSPIPLGFVLHLAHELTPTHVTHRPGAAVVLGHVLDGKRLDAYRYPYSNCQRTFVLASLRQSERKYLVLAYDACRELVLILTASVLDTGLDISDVAKGLLTALGPFFRLNVSSLCPRQFLFVFGKEAGIANRFSSGEDHHRLETQIKPNLLVNDGQRLAVLLYQDAHEGATCTTFETVTVEGVHPSGRGRDQCMSRGASTFARVSDVPSHVKAEVVDSADWTACLRLKVR
jgi:hypothetical protein